MLTLLVHTFCCSARTHAGAPGCGSLLSNAATTSFLLDPGGAFANHSHHHLHDGAVVCVLYNCLLLADERYPGHQDQGQGSSNATFCRQCGLPTQPCCPDGTYKPCRAFVGEVESKQGRCVQTDDGGPAGDFVNGANCSIVSSPPIACCPGALNSFYST